MAYISVLRTLDITEGYAITAGGIFFILLFVQLVPHLGKLVESVSLWISKHFIYPYALNRHRGVGPWSRATVLIQLIYITANVFCLGFRISSMSKAGLRAGILSLINMVPVFAGPHHSFLADMLGVSLSSFRRVHRSAGLMSFSFAFFHVLVAVAARTSFPLSKSQNLFTLIATSALGLLLLLSFRIFRHASYELFLRTHQALAGLFAYSMWRHLPSDKLVPRLYLYISAGLFLSTCLLQCGLFVRTNGLFRYHCSRANISQAGGAVRIRIRPGRRLKMKPGQYVNLWIPSVSFWSFTQSHPFVVISWAVGEQDTLDLFIEPRRGLTRELLYHAKSGHALNPLVMFSGPHGSSVSMEGYETVLMVASGFGIAAQLPYLKRLIHGYNAREVRARRIHLIWQIEDKEVGIAGQSLLNGALVEDKLDDGCILSISIYWQSSDIPKVPFGKRATLYPGVAPLQQVLAEEVVGEHVSNNRPEDVDWDAKTLVEGDLQSESLKPVKEGELESGRVGTRQRSGKMLVTVSANDKIRDELRMVVRGYLGDGVSMVELDYQPVR